MILRKHRPNSGLQLDAHPDGYDYRIYDHCININLLREWEIGSTIDCYVYSNVVYFKTEEDAMVFILRWS